MKKVALLLSGCGVLDGSEINEAVLTALALSNAGVAYQFLAPNIKQHHVMNHLTGTETAETREVLVESARIARGEIIALDQANPNDYFALIVPGGFGAAKNLCDFALQAAVKNINADVKQFVQAMLAAKKPAGFICIAPVIVPQLLGEAVKVTIGNDVTTADAIRADGGIHVDCLVTDVVIDASHNIVTTPAFMVSNSLADIFLGISKLVAAVIKMRN